MKNRRMLERGLYVGAGLFLGYAVLLPLLTDKTLVEGLREGIIAGFFAVGAFAILAHFVPAKPEDPADPVDEDRQPPG